MPCGDSRKMPSRFARGGIFACSLLVGLALIWNYLHSKLLILNDIDIVLDHYIWVEWRSAFQTEGRLP